MTVVTEQQSFGDKLHIWFTKARVPLMALPIILIIAYLHRMEFFLIGLPVCILGEAIQMWATSHLHKDQKLTISGPYSHIRNPMYFGRFFVGLGLFIMTANPYLVGLYILAYVVYVYSRVGREEKRLQGIFGEPYINYCSEINRFFPKLKPYSRSEDRKASWKQMCVNHEQLVAIGVAAGLAAIYLRLLTIPGHWPG